VIQCCIVWSDALNYHLPAFLLTPSQLFLILGKGMLHLNIIYLHAYQAARSDGADLLSLSIQYDAHIIFSSNPLSVKAEGVRGRIDKLSDHIEDLKNVCGFFTGLFVLRFSCLSYSGNSGRDLRNAQGRTHEK
jgi:hypothetical protein